MDKARIIEDLIEKYLENKITPEEMQLLNEWYDSFPDTREQVFVSKQEEETIANRIADRVSGTIAEAQDTSNVRPLFRMGRFSIVAAAVIVILGFSFFFYFFPPTVSQNHAVVQTEPAINSLSGEIRPGSNKAVLTLADGSAIILDSVSNGVLSRQGAVEIQKLDSGLLSYVGEEKREAVSRPLFNAISTPRGGQYQVTLSDGTKVWLNAASSIRFPVNFTGNERRVYITGEVYFEIAKDRQHPFRVELNNGENVIEVLGTHFNVNAYDDEAAVKTTLIEGKVKLTTRDHDTPSILLPGQQSETDKEGNTVIRKNADTEAAIAWIHGNFQFRSAGLQEILRQVARWYDVDIEYKEDLDMHFTGQLPRSESVYTVFKHLSLTGAVHFTINGRKVIVSSISKS
ncbi:MAG: FecR domain-containing protein [Chitinophagaceae bacterium]|nr:FecR domain-containing protein [Chitinophagaceae bacterium]